MILAFYPCVRFEDQIQMWFRGTSYQQKKMSQKKKLEYNLYHHRQLTDHYENVTKLAIVCLDREIPLIIENPYSTTHYLTKYWSIQPKIIDKNRRERGDYMVKPTQFWFIGCEPKHNFVDEPVAVNELRVCEYIVSEDGKSRATRRSEIAPDYAERFIKEFIADNVNGEWKV